MISKLKKIRLHSPKLRLTFFILLKNGNDTALKYFLKNFIIKKTLATQNCYQLNTRLLPLHINDIYDESEIRRVIHESHLANRHTETKSLEKVIGYANGFP